MRFGARFLHYIRGRILDYSGRFPYFGTTIYFPRRAMGFLVAWEWGGYELENARILQSVARPDTWVFDVGANIGLMSVPILQAQPKVRVLAFEPSPNNIPYLSRSIREGAYRDRWTLVPKVAGAQVGRIHLTLASPENSMFDGLRSAGHVAAVSSVEVDMTTLDAEWERLGRPDVSAIKCDVEGAELQVLAGAAECIRATRPSVLLEWNARNLAMFGAQPGALLEFATRNGYRVLSTPGLVPVSGEAELRVHMAFTEYFLLLPD